MVIVKKQEQFYWLFADSVGTDKYEVGDYKQDFETNKKKNLDVLVFSGKNASGIVGDFLIADWNIQNWNDIIDLWGEDTDMWKGKFCTFRPALDKEQKPTGKLILQAIE